MRALRPARLLLTALLALGTLALCAAAKGTPDAGALRADAGPDDRELVQNLELLREMELLQNLDLVAPPPPDAGSEEE